MSDEGGLGGASDPMSVSDPLDPDSQSMYGGEPEGCRDGCRETKIVGMLIVARY